MIFLYLLGLTAQVSSFLYCLWGVITLEMLILDHTDAQQGYLRRHGSKPSELGVLAPSIDFFPEVPADWDRFIPGGAGVYIESDCLRVRTRIFELESAIKSSGVESSTQMLAVELHSHNASSRDRVGIVVVRSRRKDHYVRKFHNRGLFRINYHNGEDTCQGFFGHRQWRWTDDQWYKARFMGFKDIYIDYH
jgi:hypothetical protein